MYLLSKGATDEAIEYSITYLKVYAIFSPIMPIYFATDNFLRVCGKVKLSMWINVGTQLLNIVLDFILIVVFEQGVWAAAFASCISISLGSIITLLLFKGRRYELYYVKGRIRLKQFLKLLVNGSSEFFSSIAMSITMLAVNFCLLYYGGTTAVAAFSVVMYVDSIVGMLIFGICESMQPPISYCYGAGLMKRVKALAYRIVAAAIVLSLVSMIFMFFAGKFVAPFFINPNDTHLLEMSIVAMKIFALSYIFGWVDVVFSSLFTSLEKPIYSLILSLFGPVVFLLSCLFVKIG